MAANSLEFKYLKIASFMAYANAKFYQQFEISSVSCLRITTQSKSIYENSLLLTYKQFNIQIRTILKIKRS